MFPRSRNALGPIVMLDSEENCRDILWALDRYPMEATPEIFEYMAKQAAAYDERTEYFANILLGTPPREFELAVPAREYQKVAADLALKMRGLLLADTMGTGKQQPVDAKVLTPKGWREIGALVVGDFVIGSDGKPTEVIGIFPQGVKPSYRVNFSDGSSVEAGEEHLWSVGYVTDHTAHSLVLTTAQLRDRPIIDSRPNITKLDLSKTTLHIPILSNPVEFEPKGELPFHPYYMGMLLGGECKPIPDIYKTASVQDRIDLLSGLTDSARLITKNRNSVTFHSVCKQLAYDILELVECLGGIGVVHIYDRTTEEKPSKYQVRICLPTQIKLLTTEQESSKFDLIETSINPTRTVTSVDYVRDVESVCIRVAAEDSLYTTEHCILTHNTVSAICTLTDPTTLPAVVVTLTHLPTQWAKEINRFAPNLRVHIAKKGTPDVPKDKEFDVYIISYSKLAGWADLLAGRVNAIIFDEIQELRREGSAKYVGAKRIAERCRYSLGLSGTPIYNRGGEFYNVIDIVRPGILGNRTEFLKEWCSSSFDPDKAVIKDPKAFGSYLREQGIMLRRTRADVGRELPPMSRIEHIVDCDSKALETVQNSVTELAKFILSKQGDRFDRMRAGGDLDWRMRQATGLAKAGYCAEFVKMLVEDGQKVVVYAWHHQVFAILMDRLKWYKPVLYTGEQSIAQKEKAKQDFCEGDSQVLLISLRAGAGLDGLQFVSNTLVFCEIDWSYGVHLQCEARLDRDGQKDPVLAYYLLSTEGSDPIISDALGIKKNQLVGAIDPNEDLVEQLSDHAMNGIQLLAEGILKQKGLNPEEFKPKESE